MAPQVRMMRAGAMTRLWQAARYAIRGVTPDTWMSPAQPVQPAAQQIAGRQFDYPVGYNLAFTPRAGELTSFQQLRMLADNCDLVRLCIETRKDQLTRIAWDIQAIGGKKESDAAANALIAAFRRPDGRNTWQSWLRMLVEEVMVTDAPTIYPRKLKNGNVFAFELVDGATIKVLADDQGRTPEAPSPAYQQVIKGMPAVDYSAEELVYAPRNPRVHKFYGYSPVEQILLTVNTALRRTASQLQYFTEGNIPASFASVPADWSPQQIEQFQAYWDSVVEGAQAYKRKVRFVPGGTKVTNLRDAPLKDDFDDWLARVVTYAFSLPPTQFTKQAVRTTSDTLQEASEEEGLAPIKAWVKDLMDRLIHHYLGDDQHEFVWVAEDSMDPQSQSAIFGGYLRAGVLTVNEVRERIGKDRVSNGDTLLIYTATGAVPLDQAIAAGAPAPTPNPEGAPVPPTQVSDAHTVQSAAKSVHDHMHKVDARPFSPTEAKLRGSFKVAFDEVRDGVVKLARGVQKAMGGDGAFDPNTQRAKPDRDWWLSLGERADLSGLSLAYDDYTDTLQAIAADGARKTIGAITAAHPEIDSSPEALGYDMFDVKDPNAIAWAHEHAADMLSSDGSGGVLAQATRNMIRRTIAQVIDESEDEEALIHALRESYAFSDKRAALIARTEIANAQGAGSLIGAKEVGMQSKEWLLSNDPDPCPLCVANAAQGWAPISDPFVSGAQHPLQHPNCRCDVIYRPQSAGDQ